MTLFEAGKRIDELTRRYHELHRVAKVTIADLKVGGCKGESATKYRDAAAAFLAVVECEQRLILREIAAVEDSLVD